MTINKSQGQSLKKVGLYLDQNVFTHGQLNVARVGLARYISLQLVTKSYKNYKKFSAVRPQIFRKIKWPKNGDFAVHFFEILLFVLKIWFLNMDELAFYLAFYFAVIVILALP